LIPEEVQAWIDPNKWNGRYFDPLPADRTDDVWVREVHAARLLGDLFSQLGGGDVAVTTHDLVEAHLAGDAEATGIWLKSVRELACAIGSFINILDPEAVIIGGGIARSGKALFGPLERLVDEIEWQPGGHRARILPAQLGEMAGAFGAAFNALEPRT